MVCFRELNGRDPSRVERGLRAALVRAVPLRAGALVAPPAPASAAASVAAPTAAATPAALPAPSTASAPAHLASSARHEASARGKDRANRSAPSGFETLLSKYHNTGIQGRSRRRWQRREPMVRAFIRAEIIHGLRVVSLSLLTRSTPERRIARRLISVASNRGPPMVFLDATFIEYSDCCVNRPGYRSQELSVGTTARANAARFGALSSTRQVEIPGSPYAGIFDICQLAIKGAPMRARDNVRIRLMRRHRCADSVPRVM